MTTPSWSTCSLSRLTATASQPGIGSVGCGGGVRLGAFSPKASTYQSPTVSNAAAASPVGDGVQNQPTDTSRQYSHFGMRGISEAAGSSTTAPAPLPSSTLPPHHHHPKPEPFSFRLFSVSSSASLTSFLRVFSLNSASAWWRTSFVMELAALAVSIVGLYYISIYSFLLFHCLTELFSILIGYCVALIVFHTRKISNNSFFLGLGIIYGYVATLDLAHVLVYRGMGVVPLTPEQSAKGPQTQLWIAARYFESIMVLALTLLHRKIYRHRWCFLGLTFFGAIATVMIFLLIFTWQVFPECFGPNGLTRFKRDSEFVIIGIRGLTVLVLLLLRPRWTVAAKAFVWLSRTTKAWRRPFICCGTTSNEKEQTDADEAGKRPRSESDGSGIPFDVRRNILFSAVCSMVAEGVLSGYTSLFGWENVVGHCFKVMSFYCIYKAMVQATLVDPYTYLFNDLTQMNQDLLLAKEKAEIALKERSEIMAWMSHEIRTPLNGIVGMLDMLRGTRMSPEQRKCADVMDGAAASLLVVINDILDFFKLESGKMTLEHLPTNLADLAHSVMALYQTKMADRKVMPMVSIQDKIQSQLLECDPTRIRQVLCNLVSNSVKFTHQGTICLAIHEKPRPLVSMNLSPSNSFPDEESANQSPSEMAQICFEVQDTGIGIESECLKDLFRPFSQLHSSTARIYGGTGLGLNIVRQLVEMMGGSLSVQSDVNIGSTFSFTVPMRRCSVPTISANSNSHNNNEDNGITNTASSGIIVEPSSPIRARVLAVDDNVINRMVISSFAERVGCQVDFATNGKEAVEYFHLRSSPGRPSDASGFGTSEFPPLTSITTGTDQLTSTNQEDPNLPPCVPSAVLSMSPPLCDIVFMDVSMPVMNGIDATAAIRQGGMVQIPIIGLTADITKETNVAGLAAGMNDIVLKPLKFQQFIDCLRKWVSSPPS